ncbi:MAG TPA: hypothetical protein VHW24_10525 [Bryobacteraceae bacterium]|nr:hypothetical protein [Bryobacteraceae bacterium]
MKSLIVAFALFLPCTSWGANLASDRVEDIVRRSVSNINADWNAAPQYDFTERDIVTRHGKRLTKTSQVIMIAGSPYNKLIAMNGEPLSAAQTAEQNRKVAEETDRRGNESSSAKQKRIAEYQKERHQDLALMAQMAKAFDFKLAGEDTINGRRCFVLDAAPKAGYRPPTRETQVLIGMRGRMWVDSQAYQWVKVHAEVFRPVTFGLFFARVNPGTEFTLEQEPIQGNLWLPSHFSMTLNARIFLASRRSSDDETYSNYHPATAIAVNRASQRQKE